MTDQLALWENPASDGAPALLRPIHYLGGKSRLLVDIDKTVAAVEPTCGTACDLFSGSGVVAAHLARHRRVVAVDIQEYARVLAAALLGQGRPSRPSADELISAARHIEREKTTEALAPLAAYEQRCIEQCDAGDPTSLCDLLENGSLLAFERGESSAAGELKDALTQASHGWYADAASRRMEGPPLARYFGGIYFSYRQALGLESALAATRLLSPRSHDLEVASVLSAASELVTTVGNHFAQPIRPRDPTGQPKFAALARVARKRSLDAVGLFAEWHERYRQLPLKRGRHEAVRADYRDFLSTYEGDLAVVYADPPYTRDHYSRFYHVLETIARQDDPGVTTSRVGGQTRISRGLYRQERHQSPFCIKSEASQAFSDLLVGVKRFEVPLVISYSPYDEAGRQRPRLMTVEQVLRLAHRVFRSVDVVSTRPIAHSKLNATRLNITASRDAEILIVCTP